MRLFYEWWKRVGNNSPVPCQGHAWQQAEGELGLFTRTPVTLATVGDIATMRVLGYTQTEEYTAESPIQIAHDLLLYKNEHMHKLDTKE